MVIFNGMNVNTVRHVVLIMMMMYMRVYVKLLRPISLIVLMLMLLI